MPSRIIKESIQTSETLASISADAERLFWRLTTAADDFGRFHARPNIVLGKCLSAFVGRIKENHVAQWLDELAAAGLIKRYDVDGQRFLALVTWDKHQRPPRAKESKFPPPPKAAAVICGQPLSNDSNCGQPLSDAPVFVFGIRESGIERHPPSNDSAPPSEQKSAKEPYATEVTMTAEQHAKLVEQFGEAGTTDRIEALSLYKQSRGKRYKCDYSTILAWERKDQRERAKRAPPRLAQKPIRNEDIDPEYIGAGDYAAFAGGVDDDIPF